MIPLHDDNPSRGFPILTVIFIVSCVVVFLWQISLGAYGQQAVYQYGMIPAVLLGNKELSPELAVIPSWISVFTSMFMHGGWGHLLGNMLYLWIFGDNVEDSMGRIRFFFFYLICGIAAVAAQTASNPSSEIPMIGASGAISGVLGAYLLLFPHARVLVVVPLGFYISTMRIPAGFVLGFWFVLQLLNSAISSGQQGGTAWWAHIGGFIAGMLLILLFKRKHQRLFAPKR